MSHFLTIIALIMMISSGFWMRSDKIISVGNMLISSNWGSVGFAFGACLMIISIKNLKNKDSN